MVNIKWYGHAMFSIERKGLVIVTDPFSEEIGYSFPKDLKATVVTLSHNHYDHNNVNALTGKPMVITDTDPLLYGPVSFEGMMTDHDELGGTKRGNNIMFRWQIDEIVFAHMGDYGEAELTDEQKTFLRQADILMIPVGGVFTIGWQQAQRIVAAVSPKIVIPMHYKRPGLNLEIDTVDKFIQGMKNVKHVGDNLSLQPKELPSLTEICVMDMFQSI